VSPQAISLRQELRELRVPASTEMLFRVRDFAEAAAEAFGLSSRDRYRVKLAASEAAANAIEHGAPDSDGSIKLRVVCEGDSLAMYVSDAGSFATPAVDPDQWSERGRGLAFIAALMDEVEVTREGTGTLVRMAKRLPVAA